MTSRTTILRKAALSCAAMLVLGACSLTAGNSALAPVAGRTITPADVAVPQAFEFIGKDAAMLALHFGAPGLTRREGEATLLQYKTSAPGGPCVLLAVLYEERGDVPRIRHMSVREEDGEAREPLACLRELAAAHQSAGTS